MSKISDKTITTYFRSCWLFFFFRGGFFFFGLFALVLFCLLFTPKWPAEISLCNKLTNNGLVSVTSLLTGKPGFWPQDIWFPLGAPLKGALKGIPWPEKWFPEALFPCMACTWGGTMLLCCMLTSGIIWDKLTSLFAVVAGSPCCWAMWGLGPGGRKTCPCIPITWDGLLFTGPCCGSICPDIGPVNCTMFPCKFGVGPLIICAGPGMTLDWFWVLNCCLFPCIWLVMICSIIGFCWSKTCPWGPIIWLCGAIIWGPCWGSICLGGVILWGEGPRFWLWGFTIIWPCGISWALERIMGFWGVKVPCCWTIWPWEGTICWCMLISWDGGPCWGWPCMLPRFTWGTPELPACWLFMLPWIPMRLGCIIFGGPWDTCIWFWGGPAPWPP